MLLSKRLLDSTRRKGSKYCSDRCKVAAYRSRKELAQPDNYIWLQVPYYDLRDSEEWPTLSADQRVAALKERAVKRKPEITTLNSPSWIVGTIGRSRWPRWSNRGESTAIIFTTKNRQQANAEKRRSRVANSPYDSSEGRAL